MTTQPITVFNPGYQPVVYTLTGLTLQPGDSAVVQPDARTLSQLSRGRLLDITPGSTPTGKTAGKSSSGEDA